MNRDFPIVEKTDRRKFCLDTIFVKQGAEMRFLEVGGRLLQIYLEKMWKVGWDSFEDYIHEMQMSRSTANKLMNIYRRFVIEFRIPHSKLAEAGGWSVLAEVLPVVKNKKDADDWIWKSKELSKTDIRREIQEAKSGVMMAECKHKDTYTLVCCNDCGIRMRDLTVKN